jgi:hypothetical protein
MTVLPRIAPRSEDERRAKLQYAILKEGADIGGQLFGPVPKGRRRQFFCLDRHTWIWHEEWQGDKGRRQAVTTRYEIRPNGIIKIQDGQVYQRLSVDETRHLIQSARLYRDRLKAHYQKSLKTA